MPTKKNIKFPIKYNMLTVTGATSKRFNNGDIKYRAVCDCGTVFFVRSRYIGKQPFSCGCSKPGSRKTHGLSTHPLHSVYFSVRKRAKDNKIKFYSKWQDNVEEFIKWGLDNGWKKGLELKRKNLTKGYKPSNCYFTSKEIMVKYEGKDYTFLELHNKIGKVKYATAYKRFKAGIPPIQALTEDRTKTNRPAVTSLLTLSAIDWAVKRKLGVYKEVGVVKWGRLRVDLYAVSFSGDTFGFEVKSCWEDFYIDKKWTNYLKFFEWFYIVILDSLYNSNKGVLIKQSALQHGCGLLVHSNSTGYSYVAVKAKRRSDVDTKVKQQQLVKLIWRGADFNRNKVRRRRRRYLVTG